MIGFFRFVRDCINRREFPGFMVSDGKTGKMKCPACGHVVIAQTKNIEKNIDAFKCDNCGEEGKWVKKF